MANAKFLSQWIWQNLWQAMQDGCDYEYFSAYLDEAVRTLIALAMQQQTPEKYRRLEQWARHLPTIVLPNGELPYAKELNELDDILRGMGKTDDEH